MATEAAAAGNVNDAEAQFLEARKARTENANLHSERRRRTDDLQEFWAAFKAFRSYWTLKLQQIYKSECEAAETEADAVVSIEAVVSESDKRRVRLELCGLKDVLELRRKQCFSHANNAPPAPIQKIQEDPFPAFTLPAHELPLSDIRLLHDEFTQCRAELDRKRNLLLPKGKFVFQRYREAIRLQQQETSATNVMTDVDRSTINSSSPSPTELPLIPAPVSESPSASLAEAAAHHDSKHTLENVSDCEVQVYTDGKVHISCKKQKGKSEDSTIHRIIQLEALDSSPLVLSNIQNSNVVIHDGSCSALHLFQVSHSTITVERPVRSVHVTACHHVQLHLQSQQLRLHESHDLSCHVKISAGAILEDCTRVVFYTNTAASAAAALDVRDFNWLRSGVPSPNYSIQHESESDGASFRIQSFPDKNGLWKEKVPSMACSNDMASTVSQTQLAVQNSKEHEDNNDDDDDDDDEL